MTIPGVTDLSPVDGKVNLARQILQELAGSASLCWEPKPTGVFDPDKASQFVDDAMEKLVQSGIVKDDPV